MKSLEKVEQAMELLKDAKAELPKSTVQGSNNLFNADVDLMVVIMATEEIARTLMQEIKLQHETRRAAQAKHEQSMRDLP